MFGLGATDFPAGFTAADGGLAGAFAAAVTGFACTALGAAGLATAGLAAAGLGGAVAGLAGEGLRKPPVKKFLIPSPKLWNPLLTLFPVNQSH